MNIEYFRETIKSAFLPKQETGGVALVSLWREEGICGLLDSLTKSSNSQISWFAGVLLAVWRLPSSLQTFLYPHLRLSADVSNNYICGKIFIK